MQRRMMAMLTLLVIVLSLVGNVSVQAAPKSPPGERLPKTLV